MSSLSKQQYKVFYDDYSKIRELLIKAIKEKIPIYDKLVVSLQLIYCLFFLGTLVKKEIIRAKNLKKLTYKKFFSNINKSSKPYNELANIIGSCNSNYVFQILKVNDIILSIPFLNIEFFRDFTKEKLEQLKISKRNWSKVFSFINKYLKKIDLLVDDFFGSLIERDLALINSLDIDNDSELDVSKIISKINDRKLLGVYYTPKQITDYMVSKVIDNQLKPRMDSLRNELQHHNTHEEKIELMNKVKKIRVLDPACGSGEFLLEVANYLLRLNISLGELLKEPVNIKQIKYQILEQNLYGADIQNISIKLTKIKLWLWFLEDLEYEKILTSTQRLLPNLFHNFHTGNSLVGYSFEKVPEQRYDYYIQPEIYILINSNILKLQRSLANYSDVVILNSILRVYTILKSMDFEQTIFTNQDILFRLYASIERALNNLPISKVFSRELYGFYNEISYLINLLIKGKYRKKLNKDTLDITREELKNSNPLNWNVSFRNVFHDGGFDVVICNPPYIENKKIRNTSLKAILKMEYTSAYKLYDISILFIERSIELLKEGCAGSFIITNKFLNTDYGIRIRKLLLTQTKIYEIIDVSHIQVFYQTATYPIIISFSKATSLLNQENLNNSFILKPKITDLNHLPLSLNTKIELTQHDYYNLPNMIFDISGHIEIIKKINSHSSCVKLKDLGDFNYRILGFTDWQNFIDDISTEKKTSDDLRFIGTANISPYLISFNQKSLKLSGKKFSKAYLNFSEKLREKWETFTSKKLLVREIAKQISVVHDPGFYANLTGLYMFIASDPRLLKPLTVILNSRLMNFYYTSLYGSIHLAGEYLRYNGSYLSELPIFIPDETTQQKTFNIIMDYIAFLKQIDDFYEIKNVELIQKKIQVLNFLELIANSLVYELFFNQDLETNIFNKVIDQLEHIPFDSWFSKIHIANLKEEDIELLTNMQNNMLNTIFNQVYPRLLNDDLKQELHEISKHKYFKLIHNYDSSVIERFF